jgi:hypothetical protein
MQVSVFLRVLCACVRGGKQKQTMNLKNLCMDKGASEEEIVMCKPRRLSK